VELENVYFDFTNDLKNQSFRLFFEEGVIHTNKTSNGLQIKLNADCFFEGLFFKVENGGFLVNQKARLELDINFSIIDQPLKASFSFSGNMKPDVIKDMLVSFQTSEANLQFQNLQLSKMNLEGSFDNNCNPIGSLAEKKGCLNIQHLEGKLFGDHPLNLKGTIHDLKHFTDVEATGKIQAHLNKLNEKLKDNSGLKLEGGLANVNFDYRGNPKTILKNKKTDQKRTNLKLNFDKFV